MNAFHSPKRISEARNWLIEKLSAGPVEGDKLFDEALAAGHFPSALFPAVAELDLDTFTNVEGVELVRLPYAESTP